MSVIADRVRELVATLPEELQEQILEYASQLSQATPRGIPVSDFQAIADLLSDEDAEAILHAIEQDCEQIHPDEW
jgi:cytochrome c553